MSGRKPTTYGLESKSFLWQNLWRNLPLHKKKSQSVKQSRIDITVWDFISAVDYVKVLDIFQSSVVDVILFFLFQDVVLE